MRRWILALILGGAVVLPIQAQQWFDDAQTAVAKARQENKYVLLDFTGSDWCGWCMKLKREVFDQPEFAEFAQANLVLVEVDFPRHKQLSPVQKQANDQLAATYQIGGFPTIILLNGDGQQVGQMGYMPGGPSAFDAELARILKIDSSNRRVGQSRHEPAGKPLTLAPIAPAISNYYGRLALKGISGTKDHRIVQINNATLMEGESAHVKFQDQDVVVCCKEIRVGSVLITADDKPMELKLGSH